jgi:hypothetical protein
MEGNRGKMVEVEVEVEVAVAVLFPPNPSIQHF